MGILGNAVTGAGGGAYTIDNSVRIRKSASAYFSRTFGSTGNQQKFTFNFWVKRGQLGTTAYLVGNIIYANSGTTNEQFNIYFGTDDKLEISSYANSGFAYRLITSQVFRDPSAWYNIVVSFDTTQATDTNRVKLYVNGSQVTSFGTSSYPTQNYNTYWNRNIRSGFAAIAGVVNGSDWVDTASYFDGYLAESYFINDQQLTPSSFGETNASTGIWQPKAYTGTYGTNGFYLKFSDIATTSGSNAGLGKDFSGNGNYWNTNNISVTAGVTYDAMKDSPTPSSATVANYAVLNPVNNRSGATISGGNLNLTTSGNWDAVFATLGATTGKYYCEMTLTTLGNGCFFGVASSANIDANSFVDNNYIGKFSNDYGFRINDYGAGSSNNEGYSTNASFTSLGTTQPANGNIYGLAIDLDNRKIYWAKNGTWYNSANPSSGTNGISVASSVQYFIGASPQASCVVSMNFGQRPFSYSLPTGFVALNTYNLATPTIGASSTTLANKYFDVTTYSGNGSTQTITNSGSFQPDFVWAKERSSTSSHALADAVRGAGAHILVTNSTAAEDTSNANIITAFTSTGFSVGVNNQTNESGQTYVGWQWKANGSGVTNTAGSITSTVSANTTSGFSVVTYTGNLTAGATIGHGLGVAPSMIIVKRRAGIGDWMVYHQSIGATKALYLNLTNGSNTYDAWWNNTAPTSSVVTLGWGGNVNNNGTMVAYCFAEIAGYSKFGSFTANGSTDNAFVYLGFRPRYVLMKRTDSADVWLILDSSRSPYNPDSVEIYANSSAAESTPGASYTEDLLSNGFKIRNAGINGTWIYAAFAESPFNYSLAR